MTHSSLARRLATIMMAGFLAASAMAAERPAARVSGIVVSPFQIEDYGDGVELTVQVTFYEPAIKDGQLILKIIPEGDGPGKAQWNNEKTSQTFSLEKGSSEMTVTATINVLQKGSIAIKAQVPNDKDREAAYYWLAVDIQK